MTIKDIINILIKKSKTHQIENHNQHTRDYSSGYIKGFNDAVKLLIMLAGDNQHKDFLPITVERLFRGPCRNTGPF